MSTDEDAPTPDELREIVVRDVLSGRVSMRDLLQSLPADDLRGFVAELDGAEPEPSFTLAELAAELPSEALLAEVHQRHLRKPIDHGLVELEYERKKARLAADARLAAETLGSAELPRMVGLEAFLAEPDEGVTYRVDGLWPRDGRIVLAAPMKAGKTTMTGNLLRSLADGVPFLGQYSTEPVQRVVLLDDEMSEAQLRRWLRDHNIQAASAINLVSLRGHLSSFNILDPATRTRWAEYLGRADVLIVDCLRPALDALGLNEHTEIGRFLEALDELAAEAGVPELLVVHHMGYGAERGRGDSRIGDWPDATWKIVLSQRPDGSSDEHGPRYFSAMGRDVEQYEAQLAHDPATRRLTIAGGSRAQAALSKAEQTVLDCLARADAAPSGSALEVLALAAGITQADYRRARAQLVLDGRVVEQPRPGRGGGKQYTLADAEEDQL